MMSMNMRTYIPLTKTNFVKIFTFVGIIIATFRCYKKKKKKKRIHNELGYSSLFKVQSSTTMSSLG